MIEVIVSRKVTDQLSSEKSKLIKIYENRLRRNKRKDFASGRAVKSKNEKLARQQEMRLICVRKDKITRRQAIIRD